MGEIGDSAFDVDSNGISRRMGLGVCMHPSDPLLARIDGVLGLRYGRFVSRREISPKRGFLTAAARVFWVSFVRCKAGGVERYGRL